MVLLPYELKRQLRDLLSCRLRQLVKYASFQVGRKLKLELRGVEGKVMHASFQVGRTLKLELRVVKGKLVDAYLVRRTLKLHVADHILARLILKLKIRVVVTLDNLALVITLDNLKVIALDNLHVHQ